MRLMFLRTLDIPQGLVRLPVFVWSAQSLNRVRARRICLHSFMFTNRMQAVRVARD